MMHYATSTTDDGAARALDRTWRGDDGAMTHDDAMRSLRLMGEEVLPAMREMARAFDLPGPFEVDPATGSRPVPAGEPATAT